MSEKIAGFCPMGCGETLFRGMGGYITCSLLGCPNPTAVADILEVRETEHIVTIATNGTFSVMHPLRERLGNKLLDCDLTARLALDPQMMSIAAAGDYRFIEVPAANNLGRASYRPERIKQVPKR